MNMGSHRLSRSGALARALAWRVRREGIGYMLVAIVPFVLIISIITIISTFTHGNVINGAKTASAVGIAYGARSDSITVGLLLVLIPGLAGLFSAIGIAQALRGLIGSEVGRGGLEALLTAPYTAADIATALLVFAMTLAFGFWAAMTGLGWVALSLFVWASGTHLTISGSYLVLSLLLPLLSAWAGTGLALMVSLLFPRLTQLGTMINLAGNELGAGAAIVPSFAVLLLLIFAFAHTGPVPITLIVAGSTVTLIAASVTTIALRFRPEGVLES